MMRYTDLYRMDVPKKETPKIKKEAVISIFQHIKFRTDHIKSKIYIIKLGVKMADSNRRVKPFFKSPSF